MIVGYLVHHLPTDVESRLLAEVAILEQQGINLQLLVIIQPYLEQAPITGMIETSMYEILSQLSTAYIPQLYSCQDLLSAYLYWLSQSSDTYWNALNYSRSKRFDRELFQQAMYLAQVLQQRQVQQLKVASSDVLIAIAEIAQQFYKFSWSVNPVDSIC
jgi:hypothetical protein